MRAKEIFTEAWTAKYKRSINCSHPKGFSQKAHCAGKSKHSESVEMEMVCELCGMCQTHGNIMEIKKGAKDSNGFSKCWPGKHADGTKKGKNGGRVRNCVPNEDINEFANSDDDRDGPSEDPYKRPKPRHYNRSIDFFGQFEADHFDHEDFDDATGVFKGYWGKDQIAYFKFDDVNRTDSDDSGMGWYYEPQNELEEDWNKVNHQDKTDGLSRKAVKAYRRENPGSKLKTAVTTKPSKLKAGSKDAKRRKSFCARMSGNKGPMKDEKGRPTPKAKALRRWNCESIEQLEQLLIEAKTQKQQTPKPRNFVAKNAIQSGAGAHKDKKKADKQGDVKHKNKALDMAEQTVIEKASRALCTGGTPDKDLGASNLASCKSQGLRARDGEKSHLITAGSRHVRIKVGGKKIKGRKYGGPLPDYGTRK
jgi:hypothetical protein